MHVQWLGTRTNFVSVLCCYEYSVASLYVCVCVCVCELQAQQQAQRDAEAAAMHAERAAAGTDAAGMDEDDSFYELTPEDLAGIMRSAEAKKKVRTGSGGYCEVRLCNTTPCAPMYDAH